MQFLNSGCFILHEKASHYFWEGSGMLSIKTFSGGRAIYENLGRQVVDDRAYLVLNHGQHYAITIDSLTPVESFCIFFAPGFVEGVYYSLMAATVELLDEPEAHRLDPLHFFERTYPHDEILSPALFRLRTRLNAGKPDQVWLEEKLHDIVHRLLSMHRGICQEVDSVPAIRAATREELYRRLHLARDYAAASFDQAITITDLARVACLSPNHFLRTFKQLFHQTPYQFMTGCRLEQSQRLLAETDLQVTEVCISAGFASLGSFSWLFRRHFGVSPREYRRQKR
jgi:AraC family transcriptional regulator